MSRQDQLWADLLAAPGDFLHGFLGGLLGPVLALAGAVGLVFLLTRKLPAIKQVTRSDGQRGKAIVLASQAEARASWARYGGEFRGAMLELRSRRSGR
jgi:hypothetical protein